MTKILCALLTIFVLWTSFAKADLVEEAPCPKGQTRWGRGDASTSCQKISTLIESRVPLCQKKDWKACWEICLLRQDPNVEQRQQGFSSCQSIPKKACDEDKNKSACVQVEVDLLDQIQDPTRAFPSADFQKLDRLREHRKSVCQGQPARDCSPEEISKARLRCEKSRLASDCLSYYKYEVSYGDRQVAESFYAAAFGSLEQNCLKVGKNCDWLLPLLSRDQDWAKACEQATAEHPRKKTYCETAEALKGRGQGTKFSFLRESDEAMALILPKDWKSKPEWPQLTPNDFPFDSSQPCKFDMLRFCSEPPLAGRGLECLATVRSKLSSACLKAAERSLAEYDERQGGLFKSKSKKIWLYSPATSVCGKSRPKFEPYQKLEVFAGSEDNCHVEINELGVEAIAHLIQNLKISPPLAGHWVHTPNAMSVQFEPDRSSKGWSPLVHYRLILSKPLPGIVDEYEAPIIWAK